MKKDENGSRAKDENKRVKNFAYFLVNMSFCFKKSPFQHKNHGHGPGLPSKKEIYPLGKNSPNGTVLLSQKLVLVLEVQNPQVRTAK